ncbi:MAG: hypothetical protein IPN71_04945 [Fibrobacteres bacterium]|nr:hypothetical protein [Fibrobacterota bacterium]
MQLLLSLLQGITMSGVLHKVPLEELVSRSQSIALVRPTGSTGSREVPGMTPACVVPWREYEVVEVLRAPSKSGLPPKIKVEPSDARQNCRIGAMMNSPVHPILIIDAYIPLDTAGLADPSAAKVLFLRGESADHLTEVVRDAQDGAGCVPKIRAILTKP